MVKLGPLSLFGGVVLAIAVPSAVGRQHSLEGNLQVGVGPLGEVEEQTLIPNDEDELIRSMASKKTTVIIGEHGDLQKHFERQPPVVAYDARAPVLEEARLFVRTETVLDTGDEGTTRYWIMGTLVACALVLLCYTSGFHLPSAIGSRLLAASGETETSAEGDTSSSVGVHRSSSYILNKPKSDCEQIAEGMAQAGSIEEIAMSPDDAVVTDSSQFIAAQKLGAVPKAHAPSTLAGEKPEGECECDREAQTPDGPDGESAEHDDGLDLAKGTAATAASQGAKGPDLKHAQSTELSPVTNTKSRPVARKSPLPKRKGAKTREKQPTDKPQPNAALNTPAAPEAQPPSTFCRAKPCAESAGFDELAKPEDGSDLVTERAEPHPASLL